MQERAPSGWSAFLRLWFVLTFSYLGVKLLFNLLVLGWVDLRRVFLVEIAVLPLGQAIVFWFATRRARTAAVRATAT